MLDFLKWYLFIQFLGLISLPLTRTVFQKLRSKGLYLAKPLGLLLWAFVYWWLVSIGLLRNDLPSAIIALGVILVGNLVVLWRTGIGPFKEWIKDSRKLIIASEVVFLVGFVFWAVVRAANPEIIHTEKFMEMAFINAILKSPGFPPHDPWLSGYSISYYYFGYVLSALLIRVTDVASSVGYNLVSALWFALTAAGAYGLLWDLLAQRKKPREDSMHIPDKYHWLALLAPLMMLVVSNWFGVLDVLHARGIVSPEALQMFNLPALSTDPVRLSWFPDRGGWSWWQASRVLQDFRLNGTAIEIIDEFPFFTFLLSDIHPHLLGMPFVLLAIAQAFNAFLGGWAGQFMIFSRSIPLNWKNVLIAVLTLGGLAFLNTWDFPFYLLLIAFALVSYWTYQQGWSGKRIVQLILLGLAGGILSILAYLPFYLSFSSQAGGLFPSLAFFTRGGNLWLMFAPLLAAIMIWLVFKQVKRKKLPGGKSFLLTLGLFVFLFLVGWGLGFVGSRAVSLAPLLNGLQGAESSQQLLIGSLLERVKYPGAFLTLFLLAWLGLDSLLNKLHPEPEHTEEQGETARPNSGSFVIMLILLGALLVIVPEFLYLQDQFGTRMNTIFKFYFQAWILWSLAGSFAISDLLSDSKAKVNNFFGPLLLAVGLISFGISVQQRQVSLAENFGSSVLDAILLIIPLLFLVWIGYYLLTRRPKSALGILCLAAMAGGLVYPVIELWNKTEGFNPRDGYSLDGKQEFYLSSADEMTAAAWLADAPLGVMAEAVSDTGGSYTTYNLLSTFSGMPSVLGWIGHEAQWRGGYEEIGTRQSDLRELYSSSSWERALTVIDQYNIRYIVVGELERQTYSVEADKFDDNLEKVFETESLDIYEVIRP